MNSKSLRRLNRKRNRFANRGRRFGPALLQNLHTIQATTAKTHHQPTVLIVVGIGLSALLYISFPTIEHFFENSGAALTQSSIALLLSTAVIYFLSGVIKGVGGIGMALISVPILSLIYSPTIAIALVSAPLIVTNVWQGLIAGDLKRTLSNFYPIIITMTATMLITAYYSAMLPTSTFSISLGVVAISFALMNLGMKIPSIAPSWDTRFQIGAGTAAGIAGGLSGLVIIPLLVYMISRKVNKEVCVPALGVLFLISGVVLILAYGMNGTMTNHLFLVSCLASVPALIGVFIGEKIRHRINESTFRRFVLYVILAIGMKIIWSAAL